MVRGGVPEQRGRERRPKTNVRWRRLKKGLVGGLSVPRSVHPLDRRMTQGPTQEVFLRLRFYLKTNVLQSLPSWGHIPSPIFVTRLLLYVDCTHRTLILSE